VQTDKESANPSDLYLLHFAVRDTGIGIPANRIDRLFQSFSQVDASTSRKYGGTGLGLAISKRLAELMGGTMWVESTVGTGSSFHFTILAQGTSVVESEDRPGGSLEGCRVLIVDDNHTNGRILREQMRRWEMAPTVMDSGKATLEVLDHGAAFDLAVLDMHMPEMNGLQLAAVLRQRPDAHFPLVMLTSLGDHFLRDEAAKLGFAAFVTKPVKHSQLQEILGKVLHGNKPLSRMASPKVFDSTFASRHPLRILLAEDNVVNQKVAKQILSKLGYSGDVVANGQEAIDALQRIAYDLVLMDVHMPEVDGLEATKLIRATLPSNRQPVILAMTAAAMQDDRDACLKAGMDGYITKPIQLYQLTTALESVRSVRGS
jgi:CheY-like chemotaxis protein